MTDIIKRDQNFRTVGAGVSNDSFQEVTMLRVDPVTNYLMVNITDGVASSATSSQIASRDQNFRPVCLAWDETNGVLQEVLTDADGNLLCDVVLI